MEKFPIEMLDQGTRFIFPAWLHKGLKVPEQKFEVFGRVQQEQFMNFPLSHSSP